MQYESFLVLLLVTLIILLLSPLAWADALPDELPDPVPSEPEATETAPVTTEPTGSTTIIYMTEAPTEPTAPVYMDIIQRNSMSTFQAVLFVGFLICGTLVGLNVLRGRYGT